MSFAKHQAEDRRLVILRLLKEASGRSANESILDVALDSYGHRVSRDTVRKDLWWLEEAKLITADVLPSDIIVATLTGHGQDVAEGTATHAGVKRPRAGE